MRRLSLLTVFTALAWSASADVSLVGAALPELRNGHGIRVESARELDERQLDVRVTTDALQHPVDVRILLPSDYDAKPERRYPVLYLFHGTSGRASDWIVAGNAVETTAGLPLIVVMPDAGFDGDGGGWFADWYNGGAGGPPMWETFHIEQVIPWIDANLRTIDKRAGRAVAGLSQGGFGALSYAARHPDLFTSVASFSGGCVIDRDPQAIAISTAIIQFTTTELSGVADPDAIFGPRATQALNWQAHDPGTLVTNLRGMHIALWTGDGNAGPLDPDPAARIDPVEVITFGATQLFHGYLMEVGILHEYNDYGGGTHTWPYWGRDLQEYVGPLMGRFDDPPLPPRPVSYMTAEDRWTQWGWKVELARAAPAFSSLERARRIGFVLTGTGRATVRTPRAYPAGARVRVAKRGEGFKTRTDAAVGRSGRLTIGVPLGDGTTPGTTRVRIRPMVVEAAAAATDLR
jgi:S-formylglutathione hydrolase FrmB